MTAVALLYSTGHAQADRTVEAVVNLFENIFAQRVVGYFVEGSYADQTAITTSDLDLTIVFREQFATVAERQQAQEVVTTCRQSSALELDITLTAEAELRRSANPMFKLGARLLYGQDPRITIPLIPIELWARQRRHAAYWLMINVFNRPHHSSGQPKVLTFPFRLSHFYPISVSLYFRH